MKKKKLSAILIKLDFQKAYNFVRWSFSGHILEAMGFGIKWRSLISCMSSASISILVNRFLTTPYKMSRGLRHEDPLFVFVHTNY